MAADEPATSQMKEFAGRTHQTARHDLARDYAPAGHSNRRDADPGREAADPAGLHYRVVGIVWGGRPAGRSARDPVWRGRTVEAGSRSARPPPTAAIWTLWEYRWSPPAAGVYSIALRIPDASVPQRRLDTGYYIRQVSIDASDGSAFCFPAACLCVRLRHDLRTFSEFRKSRRVSIDSPSSGWPWRCERRKHFQWSVKHGHTFGVREPGSLLRPCPCLPLRAPPRVWRRALQEQSQAR